MSFDGKVNLLNREYDLTVGVRNGHLEMTSELATFSADNFTVDVSTSMGSEGKNGSIQAYTSAKIYGTATLTMPALGRIGVPNTTVEVPQP